VQYEWGQCLPGSARGPLYNSSEVPALESQFKISAFLLRSHSLNFPFLQNGDCRSGSCPVLAAPVEPIITECQIWLDSQLSQPASVTAQQSR